MSQPVGKKISIEMETRIVAYLARGDSYKQIQEQIEGGVSGPTLTAVKKRNKENLAIIRQTMTVRAAEDAMAIKEKANSMIMRKLEAAETNDVVLAKAKLDYVNSEITWKEYQAEILKRHVLTISELVSVSKEMHNQTTADDKPPASQADLAALAAAIRSGDEVKITQATFNVKPD